jgi:hypothetical protein
MIPVKVECYSGFKGDQRPVRFTIGERSHDVESIDDQWYSPDAAYFRVRTADGAIYVLRHDEGQDQWTLAAYRTDPH